MFSFFEGARLTSPSLQYLMGDFHGLERRPHLAVLPTHHQSLAGSSTFIPQARRSCVEVLDNWM